MAAVDIYSTGTVSVANGDTEIVGAGGANWSNPNAKPGDSIVIAGNTVTIIDVVNATHLTVLPWPFANVAAGTYAILQTSVRRSAGGDAMVDTAAVFSGLRTKGLYVFVDPDATAPDPSLGREDQFAFQASTKKLWLKTGGVWVFQGIYKGFNITGPYDNDRTYSVGDVASAGGSSYVWINETPASGHAPPNATYWQVLAAKGDPGTDGTDGAAATVSVGTVTTGAPGSSASVTNSGTSSAAVFDFTIPRGNTGTGDVTAANKLSEYTSVANDARLNLGIRQAIQCAGSQNLNLLTDPGTYFTVDTSSINGPGVDDYWMIEVQSMAAFVAGDFAQRATGLTTGYTFTRVCQGGAWSAWRLIGGTISFSNSLASDVALNNASNWRRRYNLVQQFFGVGCSPQ
ncbi:pyocin knob domain-containing protein [Bradyrhizobium sp. USDA 10063]